MGCFSSSQPTYTPPAPPTLPTASDLYGQANNFWSTTNPTLYNAQTNAVKNSTDPNYYNSFQPSSFQQALGNQYFKNVWPDTQAYMQDQLSKSGFINSPGASQALGNTYGNLEANIGQYLSGVGQQEANQGISAGMNTPLSGLINPYVQTGMNQGNAQAQLQYGYQQAQAQQQYQQAMNNYQQQQGLAQFLGQVSPVAGNIYNATQGNLASGLGGTMNDVNALTGMFGMSLPNPLGQGSSSGGYNPYSMGYNSGSSYPGFGQAMSGNTSNGINLASSGNQTQGMFGSIGSGVGMV